MPDEINFACSDEFAELCALSTAGVLSVSEEARLEAHVVACSQCALVLNQYRVVASNGMAMIAAGRVNGGNSEATLGDAAELKRKLIASLTPPQDSQTTHHVACRLRSFGSLLPRRQFLGASAVAALVVVGMVVGVWLDRRSGNRHLQPGIAIVSASEASLKRDLNDTRLQLEKMERNLRDASNAAGALQVRSEEAEKRVKELEDKKIVLEATIRSLNMGEQKQSAAIAQLTQQRDVLVVQLGESEAILLSVKQALKASQDERQQFVTRTASLESQVEHLSDQLREREQAVRRSEQYLASDRDVRELMGARQLYIADVFDVDPLGKTRKSFGRVFYTKGKSLVFYAFDLDQEPGYREAKAFQAWGRPGTSSAQPVSLGVFYLDSEKNRRWALKFEDAKLLEEINSLFVTIEPRGGSKRPTNKPFLVAYLHSTEPNHP